MKQFGIIFRFELRSYFKNKAFVGVTLLLVAVLGVVLFFPRIRAAFGAGGTAQEEQPREVLLLCVQEADPQPLQAAFAAAFAEYDVRLAASADEVRAQVQQGRAAGGFVLQGLMRYTYYVDDLSMYDTNTEVADSLLQEMYRLQALIAGGLSAQEASGILQAQPQHDTLRLGQDQMHNFFYTYIMILALYMVILLYGQMTASGVASEKSSRAMELLITSARPVAMMFGKVLAAGLAGLAQLAGVFGAAAVFFWLNRGYWGVEGIVASIFNMPPALLGYMMLFFVLGFLIYAFLFGAAGSTVSRLEDVGTACMPVTLLFVAAFMVVVFSMASGDVDNVWIRVCSFVPFTSPMAMFTRIAMSSVPWYEVALSVGILAGGTVGVGVLAARIYRAGVLLYGTRPKPLALLRTLLRGQPHTGARG